MGLGVWERRVPTRGIVLTWAIVLACFAQVATSQTAHADTAEWPDRAASGMLYLAADDTARAYIARQRAAAQTRSAVTSKSTTSGKAAARKSQSVTAHRATQVGGALHKTSLPATALTPAARANLKAASDKLSLKIGTKRQTNIDHTKRVPITAQLRAQQYVQNGLQKLPGFQALHRIKNLKPKHGQALPERTKSGKPITYFSAPVIKQKGGDQRLIFGVVGKNLKAASGGRLHSIHFTTNHYGNPTRNGVKVDRAHPYMLVKRFDTP